MLKENNRFLIKALQATDLAVTASAFLLAYWIRSQWQQILGPVKPVSEYLFVLLIILPLWWALFYFNGVYGSIRKKSLVQKLGPVIKATCTGAVVLMTMFFIFKLEYIGRVFVVLFFLISGLSFCLIRIIISVFLSYIRSRGYNFRTVIIVGSGKRAEAFADTLEEHKAWGIRVLGFIDHEPVAIRANGAPSGHKFLGTLDSFTDIIKRSQVDEVVFVVPRRLLDMIEEPVLACEQIGIKASLAADFYPHKVARTRLEELSGWPLMSFNPVARMESGIELKRALDIAMSLVLIVAASPVFLFAIIGTKLTSRGPVLFKQIRCGMNGRRFNLLKFRTMVVNAEELKDKIRHLNEMSGPVFKSREDPRVTAFGRLLRKYSVDELPQLVNVLKGDMSIVGPRPPVPDEVANYDTWQRRRLSVRPGLTCSWQVNGRNKIGFDDWMKLDLEYIDNWSFRRDLKIMLKTIPTVLKGTGV